jgi:hypothetical protein
MTRSDRPITQVLVPSSVIGDALGASTFVAWEVPDPSMLTGGAPLRPRAGGA